MRTIHRPTNAIGGSTDRFRISVIQANQKQYTAISENKKAESEFDIRVKSLVQAGYFTSMK